MELSGRTARSYFLRLRTALEALPTADESPSPAATPFVSIPSEPAGLASSGRLRLPAPLLAAPAPAAAAVEDADPAEEVLLDTAAEPAEVPLVSGATDMSSPVASTAAINARQQHMQGCIRDAGVTGNDSELSFLFIGQRDGQHGDAN